MNGKFAESLTRGTASQKVASDSLALVSIKRWLGAMAGEGRTLVETEVVARATDPRQSEEANGYHYPENWRERTANAGEGLMKYQQETKER